MRAHNATNPWRYKDPFCRITQPHGGLTTPGTAYERFRVRSEPVPTRIRLDGSSSAIMQIHLSRRTLATPSNVARALDNSVIDKRLDRAITPRYTRFLRQGCSVKDGCLASPQSISVFFYSASGLLQQDRSQLWLCRFQALVRPGLPFRRVLEKIIAHSSAADLYFSSSF